MAKKRDDFVHLHTHSDMSQLDGCGKISDYVKTAKKRGNPAIAFTDHGTMRGYMTQYEQCKELGIKPVYGLEFYVSPDMRRKGLSDDERKGITNDLKKSEHKGAIKAYEERIGLRDRWHLNVWALNADGMRNLFKLSSAAFIEGFYYKPRIDIDELIKYGDGLAVSTGCLSSPINDSYIAGKKRFAVDFADKLHDNFGDRLALEIQPHAIADQRIANKLILALRKRYGGASKLLATQDAHYVEQKDAPHHEVLLCIGTNDVLSSPDRFKFDGDEFHMRTRNQMRDAFQRHHEFIPSQMVKEALNSTMEFAERVDVSLDIDYHKAMLPDPGIPAKYKGDHFEYLKDLCLDGWTWREIPKRAQDYSAKHCISQSDAMDLYKARLIHEMKALKRQKFVPYFIIIHDLYRWSREANIMVGPGRGSVAGCLIGYLIGITAVDPIEHGLLFERFINPNRIDMPDCDMDFEDRRRQEVIEYIRQKYGEDHVCQIATIGKMSGKQCLKDVSRALEVPYAEVNAVTNSIIERSSGDERASQTIEDSFKEFDVCRKFNEAYPEVLHHARKLEGMAKNLGIHAAGVVASPVPLTDVIPLEIRKHDGRDIVVSAGDMYAVAANGLVKLDVLGLRTLTVLKEGCEAVLERHGVSIDLESTQVDLNDPKVLAGFTAHDYGGVFQYDTPSADKVCSGVTFDSFEDVAAMTALNRPGTSRSGLASKYVDRKKDPDLVKKVDYHPAVSEITKDTLGIIVYQEHVIKIFIDIAGFAPGTADSLRKTIAKKVGDETLGKERANFVAGAVAKTGMDEATANKIMDAITFFGSYGFNKSHATAYGMIAFWCMWLKIYYPLEFYWALLKNEPDRIRIQQFAKGAKKKDIEFLPPSVSVSKAQFSIDGNSIRGSLVDIKGVGTKAAEAIMAAQPYDNFMDFLARVDRRKVHKGVVLALVRAGAFDEMLPNPRWLVDNIEAFWKQIGKKSEEAQRAAWKMLMDESKDAPAWDEEERQLIASQVSPLAFGKHPMDAYGEFIRKHVPVPIVPMATDDFFQKYDNKVVMVGGVIVEVKMNRIGDFHTGRLPDEAAQRRMFWGKRYSNVNVEDVGGKQNRIKFDWDIYPRMRPIIDMGVGHPVLVLASVNGKYENLRAFFAVAVEDLRKKIRAGEPLNVWEQIVTGQHPVKHIKAKTPEISKARWTNRRYRRSANGGHFWGVVTNVRLKYDKNHNEMAFFGIIGGDGLMVDVVCFTSQWDLVKEVISPGTLLRIQLDKRRDSRRGVSHFFNGGLVKRFKIRSPASKETA